MNATTNFTVKSLRANKVRTLVTIAGVALAAALLTAVLTTYASLNDFLYRNEAALAGTWMACVEADDSSVLDERITGAQADPQVSGTAIMRDIGFAELTADQQDTQGTYLAIRSIEGDVGDICGIEPSEGRLPESDREIMLFATWNDYGGVSLGDTVTFNVGQRVARLAPGEEGSMSAGTMTASWGVQEEAHESEITDGTPLNSSMGVLEADIDGGIFNEEVTNTEERTYTVVGFYDRPGYALSTAAGMVGVTAGAAAPDAFTDVFLTLNDVTNTQQVEEAAEALFPDEHVVLHTAMLRYMGVSSDSSIWTTFYGLVVVLAAVIVVACVSLIFNAFNISVAERIKQFGLLSSVGASRRQLRRAVVLEGAIVAVIGIPCGLLIGLAGCAVTFAALGPALAQLAGSVEIPFRVAVNGWVLLVASVLTFVTVLVSVWIPAKRASRTNIIDSLRAASGSRVSRRGAARAAKCTAPSSLWKARGAAGRVLGVGGMLARISRKRGTGKGRAASVSLALAIVLLMTAGSLSVFLGTLTDVVTGGGEPAGEVGVWAQLDTETPQGEGAADGDAQTGDDGTADSAGAAADDATQPAAPTTPEAVAAANNELFARQAEVFAGAFHDLSQVDNAQPVGWKMGTGLYAMLPEAMAGEALANAENGMGGKMADGRVGTVGSVAYLDDAAFDDYAKSLGLDPADFRDPAHLRAIVLAQGYGNNGSVYQLLNVLREPGTLEALTAVTYHGEPAAGIGVGATSGEGNAEAFAFQPYLEGDDDGVEWFPLEEAEVQTVSVEVVALAEEAPAIASARGEGLQLIVPESMAAYQGFGSTSPIFYSYFDSADGDHGALAEELATAGSAYFHDKSPYGLAFYSFNDYIEQRDSNQMIATVVNVFCLLFAVILALIAMANVFNTVTNSLILRRREFAVMKSVGLSNRQFRAMVAEECAAWCIRGLVPGVLLSLLVSFLLWQVISGSMTGLAFTLPWSYVALAAAMTVAAVGASVAYGMHRCRADNVVEALRADAV
ncbi:ABC transporter permease [uncultured Adlercreutzia sp.]|uniref:ABC transporter permease n=1 Tax=uncultured Adlercreutzia sp. TaxID=875803 RepID=UPI00266700FC|nr:ABC transporter permease [uncultured Adlercreutzia sp.]